MAGRIATLDEIGVKYGTDKAHIGHNYLKHYDRIFTPIRDQHLILLEIGVWEAASLRMWKEYFPNAEIVGIDIEDKSHYKEDRITTMVRDQSNVDDLLDVTQTFDLNIIIDDGSHEAEHQILSFNTLFPYLKPDGYYIIEDTLCSFDKSRWGKNANVFDRIHQMVDEVNVGGKINAGWICANKEQQVNVLENLNYFEKSIEWVFVGMGFVIVKKLG